MPSATPVLDSTNQPNPASPSGQRSKGRGSTLRTVGIVGLVLVAILSLGFAGYTAMNPHTSTVTQPQYLTNTQLVYSTQTVTSVSQVTLGTTVTSMAATGGSVGSGPGSYQVCTPYGCTYSPGPAYNTYNPYSPPSPWNPGYYNGIYYGYWNGNFFPPCQTGGYNNTVTCSGYLFQASNGCTVLVIPVANPYYSESFAYQYYTLHNLPSTAPSSGTWTSVTGQLYQGSNTSSSGAACPGNYINVTSIS